jgi:hypothetical protein
LLGYLKNGREYNARKENATWHKISQAGPIKGTKSYRLALKKRVKDRDIIGVKE